METKEWTYIDKSAWERGQWDDEPDIIQWQDADTGLPCLAKRHPDSGNLCGYVGVSEGHSAYEKGCDDVEADVHGGLTYARHCEGEPGRGICHLPAEGEPDRVWWLGFDCAHAYDYSPGRYAREPYKSDPTFARMPDEIYRSLQYVKNECARLAAQLAGIAPV